MALTIDDENDDELARQIQWGVWAVKTIANT